MLLISNLASPTIAGVKTSDLMDKPLSVVVEFIDTKTNKKYFVKAKGRFL